MGAVQQDTCVHSTMVAQSRKNNTGGVEDSFPGGGIWSVSYRKSRTSPRGVIREGAFQSPVGPAHLWPEYACRGWEDEHMGW